MKTLLSPDEEFELSFKSRTKALMDFKQKSDTDSSVVQKDHSGYRQKTNQGREGGGNTENGRNIISTVLEKKNDDAS